MTGSRAAAATTGCPAAPATTCWRRHDRGAGDDVMSGGAGSDTFVFTGSALGDRDRITDFRPGSDRMHLGSIDADATRARQPGVRLHRSGAAGRHAGQLAYRDGVLAGDTDGAGRADFRIELTGGPELGDDDFLL